jgi:hypothetical protein
MKPIYIINANNVLVDMFRHKERLAPHQIRRVHTPDDIRGLAADTRIVDLGFEPRTPAALDRAIAIADEMRRRGLTSEFVKL